MKRIKIKAGQVWVTRRGKSTSTPSRRILGIAEYTDTANSASLVFYSSGDSSRSCERESFLRWIARHDAKATRTRRPRTLALR